MARQKLPATAVAVSLALLTTGEHAVAQSASELETRLQAGAATTSRTDAASVMGAMALTPSLRFANRHLTVNASGSARVAGQRWYLGDAGLSAEGRTSAFHSVRAEVVANASRVMVDPATLNQQLDAIGRLHLIREQSGMWLGSGIVRPLRVATVSNVNVRSAGVWTKVGPATLRATVTNFLFTRFASHDTAAAGESGTACSVSATQIGPAPVLGDATSAIALAGATESCRRESRLTDLEGGVHWEHRQLEVSARGGRRFGHRLDVSPASRVWGSAQAAVWLSNQIAAVAGGGREPAQPTRGLPARNFASAGIMLAYWPIPRGAVLVATPANLVRAFELRPAGVALQRVTARIGGVEKVEIMGDFTDWVPVSLQRRGRDFWELLVPMSAGVHQINLRIDGGKWIAPPGIPSVKDDFSGEVGVLVIKS